MILLSWVYSMLVCVIVLLVDALCALVGVGVYWWLCE